MIKTGERREKKERGKVPRKRKTKEEEGSPPGELLTSS